MKLFEAFKKINKEESPIPRTNPIHEKALQIFGILTTEDKIKILRYRSIPPKFIKVFQPNDPLFEEVYNLVDKYYK